MVIKKILEVKDVLGVIQKQGNSKSTMKYMSKDENVNLNSSVPVLRSPTLYTSSYD